MQALDLLNTIFTHLDFPFNSVQLAISLTLTTQILLYIFPLIKAVLAWLSPFEIRKNTFVSCTTDELINNELTIKRYL